MQRTNKKNKTKKIKKFFEIGIAIFVVTAVSVFAIWSAWFGYNNPQTGLQHAASLAGRGKVTADAPKQIIFLGDSITAREDWNVLFGVSNIVNTGISGNTTDDILDRLNLIINVKSKKIFLMIGVNDLLRGRDVSYVLANYEKILGRIKKESPQTMVYVESVLPVNNDISGFGTVRSQEIVELNSQLGPLAEKNGATFINLYPSFCGSDNKLYPNYSKDGLHPNANGYTVWKNLISQYLE